MDRRQCLAGVSLAAAAAVSPRPGRKSSYPSRPVKVVVGFPAGSATDVATRAVAEALGQRLGQPFVVDNRPGAASNIAAKAVATSPADGYTIFVGTIANTINAAFPNSTSPDLAKDFAPVTMIGSVPNVLVVNPSLGVTSVDQLIRAAKAKPGQITFASSGNGTSPHLSGELFSAMAGIKMLHVPYRGSTPAVTDLLGGQVQVMFSPASTVLPHIRAGKLKALATTGAKRTATRARSADDPGTRPQGFRNLGVVRIPAAGGHAARCGGEDPGCDRMPRSTSRRSRICSAPRASRSSSPPRTNSPTTSAAKPASGPRSSRPPASSRE